ncbi:hypothetical protein [Kribbella lupini]|uniref:Uncharacterized protein n=1 Tax=Kribbella lupini TaxID=291602 RepID=A0ABP4N4L4_9ACTN
MRYRADHFVVDGALRDVCVLDAALGDWQRLISALPSCGWEVSFTTTLPEPSAEVFEVAGRLFEELDLDGQESATLAIAVDGTWFTCYFFEVSEIEFTFHPDNVTDQASFGAVERFMAWLGDTVGKRAIMTMEGSDHPSMPALLEYVPVARRTGGENLDLSSGHARWDVYRRMMDSPVEWGRLLEFVAAEPDPSIATSLVLKMLERVPAAERVVWVDRMTVRDEHPLVSLRLREIRILEAASGELGMEQSFAPDQISEWSDWLQRRASEESTSPGVLELLSQSGRTRRVRHLAAERLRFLRRTA